MSSNEDFPLPELLAGLRGQPDGYRAPDAAYFADQAERAIAAGPAHARSRRMQWSWQYAAAGVFLLLLAGFLLMPPATGGSVAATAQPTAEELLAQLDLSEINSYLEAQPADLETELFYDDPLTIPTTDE